MELEHARVVASGLDFPEGPVALDDGSVLVVEVRRGTLTRVDGDGAVEVVADVGGGPNGAAIGPDGAIYVCNNGGMRRSSGWGSIQRVDLPTGDVDTVYEACDGERLRAPNDLAFDADGGFWFTDYGRAERRNYHYGGVYYARPDGSSIREVVFPVLHPNGIGLAPDGSYLYWAETMTRRVMRRAVVAPGELAPTNGVEAATVLRGNELDTASVLGDTGAPAMFDSLAVHADGTVVVATLLVSGLTTFAPLGGAAFVPLPTGFDDRLVTNVCFRDAHTAYLTLAETGRLLECRWPPGDS